MVTVRGLGTITASTGPGVAVPPHVLGSFQFPLRTAVNTVACTVFGPAKNINPQTRSNNPVTGRNSRFLVADHFSRLDFRRRSGLNTIGILGLNLKYLDT
jgi:hypothetical protein